MSSFASTIILLLTILAIIPGIYLRYLPFRDFITQQQKQRLRTGYIFIGLIEFLIVFTLTSIRILPITLLTFKFFFITFWIPFFCWNLLTIPGYVPQHIFILGVQCVYTYILHTLSTATYLIFITVDQLFFIAIAQIILYLIYFLCTFKLIKNFFVTIFQVRYADNYYWRLVCILPILSCLNNLYYSIRSDIVVIEQLPARIMMAIFTFILCYCITLDLKWLQSRMDLVHIEQLLHNQLDAFETHAKILQASQKSFSIQRHDMRHHIRMLHSLIREGHTEAALQELEKADEGLERTITQSYCQNLLINTVLSIYIPKAEKENIPTNYTVITPEHLSLDETNVATVLANLLENAIQANLKQLPKARGLQLLLQIDGQHLKLQIKNRCDAKVTLGDDGLPVTSAKGHGLGMQSLSEFVKKYKAMVLCEQKNGWFITSLIIH